MRISSGDKLLDRTFFVSLIVKLADGVLELIGGAVLLVMTPGQIQTAVAAVTRGSLPRTRTTWSPICSSAMRASSTSR